MAKTATEPPNVPSARPCDIIVEKWVTSKVFVGVRSQGAADIRVSNLKDREVVSKDPGSRVPSKWCRREARTLVTASTNTPVFVAALTRVLL